MDLIVGGGKFGLKAAEYLLLRKRDFIIIDPSDECAAARKFKEKFVKAEAKDLEKFVKKFEPEWIFPTAPIHVAAEALKDKFIPWNEKVNEILSGSPAGVIVSVGTGSIVVSYNRDKICLDNCSSPEICPVTKIKRPCPMYELLRFACPEAKILISHQLSPGIGAINGKDFASLLEEARKVEKIVVVTACNCHGVLTALMSS